MSLLDYIGAEFLRGLQEHPSVRVKSVELDDRGNLIRVALHNTDLYLSCATGTWGIYRGSVPTSQYLPGEDADAEAKKHRDRAAQLARESLVASVQAGIVEQMRKVAYPGVK